MALRAGKTKTPSTQQEVAAAKFAVPDDPERLITWAETKRETGRQHVPVLQMKINMLYVLGQQWLVWDQTNRYFRRPQNRVDDPNAPVRITVNKMGGILERFVARLTKSAPEPECRPVSDSDDDIGAARAGTRILLSEMNRLDWEVWLMQLYLSYVTPLGWSYAQVTWDGDDGATIGAVDEKDVHVGNISLELVPAFELSVDPNALSMKQATWCIRERSMTPEAVFEEWGIVVPAEGTRSLIEEVYQLTEVTKSTKDAKTENVTVKQLWMKPCRVAPKGLVFTWAGKTVLEEPKPFPYKHGLLPFVQFDLLPGLGTREGRTWVTDLVPLQADYNDARSREATLRRTIVPKIVYEQGSIDPNKMTSRLEQIPVRPGSMEPHITVPDSGWMSQHEAGMNRADQEMGDRAGQSDVSSGQAHSASMPAAAILALQEADDTKLAITEKCLARGIGDVGWMILELVRQFWTEQRLVRTWSEEGHLEVQQFSGADIDQQLDVHVDAEQGIVRSKSALVQLYLDLWKAQVITDPRMLLRLLQFPGADTMIEALNVDARQAQTENDLLATGEIVQVHTWDNHAVHIPEHNDYRKGEDYRKLERAVAAGDQQAVKTKAAIDAHVDLHVQMQAAQQMQQAPAQGTPQPPGPGGPGGTDASPGMYLDPQTGMPPDPAMVAAGQAPSALSGTAIGARAGFGGAGQPGLPPGIEADMAAAHMGR